MVMIITDRDMRVQVVDSLTSFVAEFDVDALVDALIEAHGVCDIDDIPDRIYWATVERYAVDG